MAEENPMESLYTFLSLFKYYIITPIFIFDGKPPPEKWAALKKRRWEKKDAAERLLEIQSSISLESIELTEELQKEMDELKRKSIRIKQEDFQKFKELIDAFGFVHYEAPGEADILCAYLVTSGSAWACLSDDMDMFLYGCPRVLRNLSLMKHQIVLYDTTKILEELGINYEQLLEIAILSGTDYNEGYLSLRKTFELHNEYKMIDFGKDNSDNQTQITFSNWFLIKNNLESNINCSEIEQYFDVTTNTEMILLENVNMKLREDVLEKRVSIPKIKEIMGEYGFLFP